MQFLKQFPEPGAHLRLYVGDVLTVTLEVPESFDGQAWLRTNLGGGAVRREELVESAGAARAPLARDWTDLPMRRITRGRCEIRVPLLEVGRFAAKACFIMTGETAPKWPAGGDLVIKVAPAHTCAANSLYTAFPRQFSANKSLERTPEAMCDIEALETDGYAVIPPSGTFRDVIAALDHIVGTLRFRILQLLPVHPVPTTFARMGRYGSPFASQDFLSVDPALAVFDTATTPLDQFRELLDATHARGARLFLDLPANHTGWASALQTHHPEWFRRGDNQRFHSPGAWGTVWEDLAELDYAHDGLRDYMAGVFEFWCREGVDGFRCDAGYMIPAEVWTYIVARVRRAFPDTVFLLEGLGGKLSVTRALLDESNLDWAYSEIFQTEDRAAFEWYLPGALALSSEVGPLIHFAETHDNTRLAARSQAYAEMRTAVAALLSEQGAFGITNGVEWFATERVNVHGASALRWGGAPNQVEQIRRLNTLLATHAAFGAEVRISMQQTGEGNALAVLREPSASGEEALLVLANLDSESAQSVQWPLAAFDASVVVSDLLNPVDGVEIELRGGHCHARLQPGQVLCLTRDETAADALEAALAADSPRQPTRVARQELRALALRVRDLVHPGKPLSPREDADAIADEFARDPIAFVESCGRVGTLPPLSHWQWPRDADRTAPIPPGQMLLLEARVPFRARIETAGGAPVAVQVSLEIAPQRHVAVFDPLPVDDDNRAYNLCMVVFAAGGTRRHTASLLALRSGKEPKVRMRFDGAEVRGGRLLALLTNGRGAMSHVPADWPNLRSRYDALLAANPDPRVPCDRWVLFSRCRIWLRYRGYSHPVDASCLHRFETQPGSNEARWEFRVPTGLGRSVALKLVLGLEGGANRVRIALERGRVREGDDGEVLDDGEAITLILRPDIESRSFHETTKAYTGPEQVWVAASHAEADGVRFEPAGLPWLHLRGEGCAYTHEPEWHYMVSRPLEKERGLEDSSDLYSPGFFSGRLRGGERLVLTAAMHQGAGAEVPLGTAEARQVGKGAKGKSSLGLKQTLELALREFVVRRDQFHTVIAGYPWFLDWGRDTFIVLRGMVSVGMTDEVLGIVREFARFERAGTLPNMIRGNDDSNRDTSDAPLWFIVAVRDLAMAAGNEVLEVDCGGRALRQVLLDIADGYRKGTPNGIRMDEESALVFSPSHFTWMDTNHPAATPREGYPIEIQALWISALHYLSELEASGPWRELVNRATGSLDKYFWMEERGMLRDCLHAEPGTPAASARGDDALRCNALFAITLGAFRDEARAKRHLRVSETLLVPGAIRTLAELPTQFPLPVRRHGRLLNDPGHPYWGRYEGDEDTRRKPAYHNGTAWTWPFPSYAEALLMLYGRSAAGAARALLEGVLELFGSGAVGHLPEIVDGDAPHAQRGCDAQAWSVSEVLRVLKMCNSPWVISQRES